jgi:hypothetical protein
VSLSMNRKHLEEAACGKLGEAARIRLHDGMARVAIGTAVAIMTEGVNAPPSKWVGRRVWTARQTTPTG